MALALTPSDAYSGEVAINSGQPLTITVSATIKDVSYIPDSCEEDDTSEKCQMIVFVEEPKHICEENPQLTGCKYYKPGGE